MVLVFLTCILLIEWLILSVWQVNEMELTRSVAERVLREHKGNVFEALVDLTN